MKLNKVHEVERISKLVMDIITCNSRCDNTNDDDISDIIDIGSGKGYLTQQVAISCKEVKKDINIIAVERSSEQMNGCEKRSKRYKVEGIAYVQCDVGRDGKLVSEIVRPYLLGRKLMLIGLHTCGDLASSCCRYFVRDERVSVLVNVGCCYHKLDNGYPLSKAMQGYKLSSSGKRLAIYQVHAFYKKRFRMHSYRVGMLTDIQVNFCSI